MEESTSPLPDQIVEHDVRPVHRNLVELAERHLIELVTEWQARRPHVWYDSIELDLPLVSVKERFDEASA